MRDLVGIKTPTINTISAPVRQRAHRRMLSLNHADPEKGPLIVMIEAGLALGSTRYSGGRYTEVDVVAIREIIKLLRVLQKLKITRK